MACNCILNSSFLPSLPLYQHPNFRKPKTLFPISCNLGKSRSGNRREVKEDKEESIFKRAPLNLLKFSVTLTVISVSLPQPCLAAAKVSEKKRSGKRTEALTPEELRKWTQGLPVQPEVVLAVLEDNKVVRVVLPSVESDSKFWEEWDELQINGLCINAYSPPLKKPEIPKPYLWFLSEIPSWMFSLVKPKPQSKKALELKRMREEFRRRKDEELAKMRQDRVMMEKAMNMQKKMAAKQRRMEVKKVKYEESLRRARRNSESMAYMWNRLASDSNVSTALGFVFFYIFYRTVVLNKNRRRIRGQVEDRKGRG
ncbi:UNVERIFIED_CONTAM: putative inactive ATP-dependent zinc metalloprotease FTSHI 2, chloroplastic [Sesamum calycinum]|uniref:Inactive ATP-dependent zinc metalloprotease FTSHI 2, chloroplastic n=1 Tax=Sesamum calycinum TaxID=2727403 RepID=A0AAW2SY68_9LAMI